MSLHLSPLPLQLRDRILVLVGNVHGDSDTISAQNGFDAVCINPKNLRLLISRRTEGHRGSGAPAGRRVPGVVTSFYFIPNRSRSSPLPAVEVYAVSPAVHNFGLPEFGSDRTKPPAITWTGEFTSAGGLDGNHPLPALG
jgi:hypothetical protein